MATESVQIDDENELQIRGYLASMRPIRGVVGLDDGDEYQRGRRLIEKLALSARGHRRPTLKLTADECADVLHFISDVEPVDREKWWKDPNHDGHTAGFVLVLDAVRDSLRESAERPGTEADSARDETQDRASMRQQLTEAMATHTPLEVAIDRQREQLFNVQAVLHVTAEALAARDDADDAGAIAYARPVYESVRRIDGILDALDRAVVNSCREVAKEQEIETA
jgi:hypothetical protein